MTTRRIVVLAAVIVCLAGFGFAQEEEPFLKNWSSPPYWNPAVHPRAETELSGGMLARVQGMQAESESLPSSPLPFVAIAPCRIVDTRVAVSDGFHQPNFIDGEARSFPFPSSPDCPGLPATAGAWSVNIQFRPMSQLSYLTAYPTGTPMPTVSTLTAGPAAWVQNSAIVPAGTSGSIDIYCQYAGRVVIDINGYYGPQSVVTSLNTLAGDVTLAEGDNVTITPSGQTLTIAATGGPGGELPAGSTDQTLRHDGTGWAASSALTNNGIDVALSGNLDLPATTAGGGTVRLGTVPFLHDYHAPGSDGQNTFVGRYAGNFTLGGAHAFDGAYNTAAGAQSLYSDTTGSYNTAVGSYALRTNAGGSSNTGTGYAVLYFNSSGFYNTATGYYGLFSNTTGSYNTASGYQSLQSSTTANNNTAHGAVSLFSTTTGQSNTAIGYQALYGNTTGSYNIGIGYGGGTLLTTGDSNIAIGHNGVAGDHNTIRLGNSPNHTRTFIAGIYGMTTGSQTYAPVIIDNFGQLGTIVSSIRFKQDVADMGDTSSRLLQLRPVTFHYKAHPDGPLQYGLVAEEVEQVMPELVVKDATGQPETVAYHELPAMLLNELQKQQATISALEARVAETDDLRTQVRELRRQVNVLLATREGSKPVETVGN